MDLTDGLDPHTDPEIEIDGFGTESLDLDQDGANETVVLRRDGADVDYAVLIDSNDDGSFDLAVFDTNADGVADLGFRDNDHDGVMDDRGADTDGDGLAEIVDIDTGAVLDDPEPPPPPAPPRLVPTHQSTTVQQAQHVTITETHTEAVIALGQPETGTLEHAEPAPPPAAAADSQDSPSPSEQATGAAPSTGPVAPTPVPEVQAATVDPAMPDPSAPIPVGPGDTSANPAIQLAEIGETDLANSLIDSQAEAARVWLR